VYSDALRKPVTASQAIEVKSGRPYPGPPPLSILRSAEASVQRAGLPELHGAPWPRALPRALSPARARAITSTPGRRRARKAGRALSPKAVEDDPRGGSATRPDLQSLQRAAVRAGRPHRAALPGRSRVGLRQPPGNLRSLPCAQERARESCSDALTGRLTPLGEGRGYRLFYVGPPPGRIDKNGGRDVSACRPPAPDNPSRRRGPTSGNNARSYTTTRARRSGPSSTQQRAACTRPNQGGSERRAGRPQGSNFPGRQSPNHPAGRGGCRNPDTQPKYRCRNAPRKKSENISATGGPTSTELRSEPVCANHTHSHSRLG
jgi:hypothetical protein